MHVRTKHCRRGVRQDQVHAKGDGGRDTHKKSGPEGVYFYEYAIALRLKRVENGGHNRGVGEADRREGKTHAHHANPDARAQTPEHKPHTNTKQTHETKPGAKGLRTSTLT